MYAFIGSVLLLLSRRSSKLPLLKQEDEILFKLPSFYKFAGIVFMSLSLVVSVLLHLLDVRECLTLTLFLNLVIFPMGLSLYLEGRKGCIILNTSGITRINYWGRKTVIAWKDIQNICFNRIILYLVVRGDGKFIHCHIHLKGFASLVERLEIETDIKIKDMKLPDGAYPVKRIRKYRSV